MVSKVRQPAKGPKPNSADVDVYGHVDRRTVDAIDRLADQMLMPRSWVVSQILREWAERRTAEICELEESWNGSVREELGRQGVEGWDDATPRGVRAA